MGFSTHQLSGGSLERLNEKDRNERQRASHEDRRFSPGSKDDQPEGEKDQRGKKRKRKKGRKKMGMGENWRTTPNKKEDIALTLS